ncbi:MAG: cellulase family glycosylhydrolase [Chloroflexota bacterium]
MTTNRHRLAWLAILAMMLFLAACRERSPEAALDTPATTETPVGDSGVKATTAVHLPLAPAGDGITPAAATTAGRQQEPPTPESTITGLTATPSPEATVTPLPAWLVYDGPTLARDQMGLQIHLHREDQAAIVAQLGELGVGWVKTQISWKLFQPGPERVDEELFAELDDFIALAVENDLQVMLGVAKAPEWSRPTTELDGPPSDYGLFQQFMTMLAGRYQGRVAAYELWNEPNLQREWNGAPLSAAALVDLVRAGAAGVRGADPQAVLISAAPATTGVNDGLIAIDDRQYLGQMLAAGVANVVDAIGAHPYGWANPPDSSVHDAEHVTSSHNDHPSFYFADTLDDYRRILEEAGYGEVPIWVTEFGWGSYDGLGRQPPEGQGYMAEVSEPQQAIYTRRAFVMAQERSGIGPLILWNLNFGPTFGADFIESSYSLLRPDGTKRPVYQALVGVPKR